MIPGDMKPSQQAAIFCIFFKSENRFLLEAFVKERVAKQLFSSWA